jgi:hypothetical protein
VKNNRKKKGRITAKWLMIAHTQKKVSKNQSGVNESVVSIFRNSFEKIFPGKISGDSLKSFILFPPSPSFVFSPCRLPPTWESYRFKKKAQLSFIF